MCGRCGRLSPGQDGGAGRRRWRSLDEGAMRTYIEAHAPGCGALLQVRDRAADADRPGGQWGRSSSGCPTTRVPGATRWTGCAVSESTRSPRDPPAQGSAPRGRPATACSPGCRSRWRRRGTRVHRRGATHRHPACGRGTRCPDPSRELRRVRRPRSPTRNTVHVWTHATTNSARVDAAGRSRPRSLTGTAARLQHPVGPLHLVVGQDDIIDFTATFSLACR